ncbi:hypothetical protein [Teichococcus vastitatis]|uniref:Uncharacterized protein n=1 Tax=Teichococcus vastitatis TaxID=2307076 RepID=A0ABS9W618_9PROT|nr:hypothetical protein [Pseudoroseomonas vastitatis]MCI0754743.1 hypothetical protein [Pseudoroseomonas vastitatis]
MLLRAPRSSSKVEAAINLLQHLGAVAAYEGEPCSKVLFMAADYLQDVLDSSPELGAVGTDAEDHAAYDAMMSDLGNLMGEEGLVLHS